MLNGLPVNGSNDSSILDEAAENGHQQQSKPHQSNLTDVFSSEKIDDKKDSIFGSRSRRAIVFENGDNEATLLGPLSKTKQQQHGNSDSPFYENDVENSAIGVIITDNGNDSQTTTNSAPRAEEMLAMGHRIKKKDSFFARALHAVIAAVLVKIKTNFNRNLVKIASHPQLSAHKCVATPIIHGSSFLAEPNNLALHSSAPKRQR